MKPLPEIQTQEADIERRKVVGPTHQETLQTALMVIIVTILISLFLGILAGTTLLHFVRPIFR